jgi:hypothetical protein
MRLLDNPSLNGCLPVALGLLCFTLLLPDQNYSHAGGSMLCRICWCSPLKQQLYTCRPLINQAKQPSYLWIQAADRQM